MTDTVEKLAEAFRGIGLLRDLPGEIYEFAARHSRRTTVEAGRQIIGQSDLSTEAYFLLEGTVTALRVSVFGREVIFRNIDAGEVFGELSALDGQPRSSSVIAHTRCVLATMRAADFERMVERYAIVSLRLNRLLAGKVRDLTQRLDERNLPVPTRVRLEMLRLAEHAPSDGRTVVIAEAPTHQSLASMIGTHREAVTREIGHLAAENILRLRRGTLEILDLPRLRTAVSAALQE